MQPPPAAADRDAQMDAIRRMLSDLKETAEKAPPAAPEPRPDAGPQRRPAAVPEPEPAQDERVYNPFEEQTVRQSEAPRQMRRRASEDEDVDPLRARIDDVTAHDKAVKGEATAKTNYDAHRLRKKHEKRAKKMQRARERRRSSGGFFTGFLLVVVVSGTMSGLYSFHRQIIAASPDLEPAMIEYVTVVDQYRVQLAESTKEWRELVTDKIKRFTKKGGDEAGAGDASTGGSG